MKQTALITGASKRIGRAIAEHLAKKGWNILIHYNHSETAANELATALKQRYPGLFFDTIQANLLNTEETNKLISSAIVKSSGFNLLVNNASVFNSGYIRETSTELFENQINVNLKAPFILMRDFALHCKVGNIINLVDTRISNNKTNYAAYSLSKKGLWELTKMAALEFGPDIRVNAIAPGITLHPDDKDEDYLNKLAERIPLKEPTGIEPILESIDFIICGWR
jgi:NAD(P)-dependent dehydrogenase (short-subunit alcohol dehydrogenase family)